ncbi:MAG: CPBP family intramembrane metalloprotease [Leptolyngbya sp.]|nr:CPBP family intramembrane metalloprotease [Candidatus Melainabacteria bacterium]
MLTRLFQNLWSALVAPKIRLEANFPWTLGKSLRTYGVASLFYLAGTLVPLFLFSALFKVAIDRYPAFFGNLSESGFLLMIVCVAIASFISGFAAELWYIRLKLEGENFSFRKTLALNLDSLKGSWWSVLWRAFVAFGLVIVVTQVVEMCLPVSKIHDPAAEFAKSLTGIPALLFMFLGVVLAPFLEEVVFRGFLYNALRTSFRSEKGVKFFRHFEVSDYSAALASGVIFGLFHMNFMQFPNLNWYALPVYAVTGLVLSESYRRSGSLYVPIAVHALNNLTVMAMTYLLV